MAGKVWTDLENDAAVAEYFSMLSRELAGKTYNKAAQNRALQQRVEHSRGSIEFLHRNISAVLKGLGEEWIAGYLPAFNYANALEVAVDRWIRNNPKWLHRPLRVQGQLQLAEEAPLWFGAAPTLATAPPPDELEQTSRVARKFDVAARDERNRALGRAGEARVFASERQVLTRAGRADLAEQVRWTSQVEGDGAGFDIESFQTDGSPRLLEVKTTRGWERTPFHMTKNELAVSQDRADHWRLVRLFDFERGVRAFELQPPLDRHVTLMPTEFRASFG